MSGIVIAISIGIFLGMVAALSFVTFVVIKLVKFARQAMGQAKIKNEALD